MDATTLETLIRAALPDAEVILTDLAGDNEHYAVTVRSAQFAGKNRVTQHQMVYNALGGGMGTTLHALAVKTEAV
jgi:stress-induced morphogen